MGYARYAWAANKINPEDMAGLYHLKKRTKRTITSLVAEAISVYLQLAEVKDKSCTQ